MQFTKSITFISAIALGSTLFEGIAAGHSSANGAAGGSCVGIGCHGGIVYYSFYTLLIAFYLIIGNGGHGGSAHTKFRKLAKRNDVKMDN